MFVSTYKDGIVALKRREGSDGCKLRTGRVSLEVRVSLEICCVGSILFSFCAFETLTTLYLSLYVCACVSEFSSKHCRVRSAYFSKAKSLKKVHCCRKPAVTFFFPSHLMLFFTAFVLSQVHFPFHDYVFSLLL